jgi:hypothetical protein|tara:strand:- start:3405 stop:3683 length:279 start_codon:yes stop_codon:yes gene_type:complete
MGYKKNEVITVITVAGEYIGKFVDEGASKLIIADPKMLVNGEQGMGFGNGVCVTGEKDPKEMSFYIGGIVFIAKTSDQVEKAYREATSGIIL